MQHPFAAVRGGLSSIAAATRPGLRRYRVLRIGVAALQFGLAFEQLHSYRLVIPQSKPQCVQIIRLESFLYHFKLTLVRLA